MESNKKPKKKQETKPPKKQKIRINDDSGKQIIVGEYDSEKKLFTCKRKKSEHFMRKFNAWGLDIKVVNFLAKEGATIRLNDTEDKWEFECKAIDFKLKGIEGHFGAHKSQLFLELNEWKVIKLKNRACILKCGEIDCRYNFAKNCLSGSVILGREGNCESYEDK